MSEYKPMSITYATSLHSESFNIAIAIGEKKGKPFLMLKMESSASWHSPAKKWANGYYDYSTQTQVPPVWTGRTSPWDEMSYFGEIFDDDQTVTTAIGTPQFCGNCGTSLKSGAKFCSGCGTALAAAASSVAFSGGQFAIQFSDLVLDATLGKELAKKLAESVVSVVFSEFSPLERSSLLAFLSEEFSSARVTGLINGTKTTSKCAINLADAQKLQAAVQLGSPLTTIQAKYAELVLRNAPLSFGYWGAIKSILKAQPSNVSREAIGAGFARISAPGSAQESWWRTRDQVENLWILDSLIRVPLAPTRYYLSRLGRRKLVDLATKDPADYLALATGFLIAADRRSSTMDFMFAHIVYGAQGYLSPGSRSVRRNLSANGIAPFEPKLWSKAQAELTKIWSGVSHSREVQDFAFSLADSNKIPLPPLDGYALNLALGSGLGELRAHVIGQIARDSQSWKSLTEFGWRTFLSEVQVAQLNEIMSSFTQLEYPDVFLNALRRVSEDFNDPLDERMQILSNVYFTLMPESDQWGRGAEVEGKLAAALLVSGTSVNVENFDLLNNRLGFDGLVACWVFMQNQAVFDQDNSKSFTEAALGYWTADEPYQRRDLIYRLASSAPGLFPELATALIASAYDFELVQTFTERLAHLEYSSSLATKAIVDLLSVMPPSDVERTLDVILDNEATRDSISLVEVLNASFAARQLAWAQIAIEPLSSLAQALESNKQLLASTLFELNQSNISQAIGRQVEMLVNFFNGSKIQSTIPPDLLVGATTNPSLELANLGQKLLKKRGLFSAHWLQIAETQMPLAIGFAREYLLSVPQGELSEVLLLGLDSPVVAVRDMALELLDSLRTKIDIAFVYGRLAESRDPVIRGRVAEEALLSPWSDGGDLVTFDSELLVTLRRSRQARENVKARFDDEDSQPSESSFVTPQRLHALISLTRIGNSRDKEWALARLAQLKNAGHEIEGVSITLVSGGQPSV